MGEPAAVVSLEPSTESPKNRRLTVGLKGTYPFRLNDGDKVFLSPMVSLSEDLSEGADLQQAAFRLLLQLRPAYGLVLAQEYADAAGLATGMTIPAIARKMCGT